MLSNKFFFIINLGFFLISFYSCKKHPENKVDQVPYKVYDGFIDEAGRTSIISSDNELYIVGTNWYSTLIIKTDLDGNLIWKKTYYLEKNQMSLGILETSDGGFLVSSGEHLYGYRTNPYLIKINSDGDSLWTYKVQDTTTYLFSLAVQLKDHSIVIAGCNWLPFPSLKYLISFVKIDQNGQYLMTRTYEDTLSSPVHFDDFKLKANGNLLFTMSINEQENYIMELDESLEKMSEFKFNVNNRLFLFGYDPDQMLAIDSWSNSIASLYKLDYENNIIAEAAYSFPLLSGIEWTQEYWIKHVPEGIIVTGGLAEPGHWQYDFHPVVALLDEAGNQKWLWYNESQGGTMINVHYLSDGNYILVLQGSGIMIWPVKNYGMPSL
jgi:hypothetical protein